MPPIEQPIRWTSAGRELAGIFHFPAATARAVAVVVPAFAEEKKFSHRVMVELARALALRDVAVLRFDLSGTGDSFGESQDATLASWLEDIRSARAEAAKRYGGVPAALVGLRLGATLALASAVQDSPAPALVLWEPVVSGAKYVDEILRRRMIKEMMTTGKKATGRVQVLVQIATEGMFDLDGNAIDRRLIEELAALKATALAAKFAGKALCVQIAFNAKVSAMLELLAEKMRSAGASVETRGIREQVIWDRVETVEAKELIAATADWIAKL